MKVQINIHGDKDVAAETRAEIDEMLRDKLRRFGDLFTCLELHIARNQDVNARMDVYQCGVEARAAGKPPIKEHHGARRHDLAAEGAVVKLIAAMERRAARKRTVSKKGHTL